MIIDYYDCEHTFRIRIVQRKIIHTTINQIESDLLYRDTLFAF